MNKLLTYIILLIVAAGCSNINEPKTIAIQTLSGFASDLKDTIKQSIIITIILKKWCIATLKYLKSTIQILSHQNIKQTQLFEI